MCAKVQHTVASWRHRSLALFSSSIDCIDVGLGLWQVTLRSSATKSRFLLPKSIDKLVNQKHSSLWNKHQSRA